MNKNTKKISTILIANRGEISSRISRTCRNMGIRSVAVYSDVDRNSLFVKDADMAVFIGDNPPAKSYLDQDKIINAAKRVNADAIHPGYGFLSENHEFALRCQAEGIIFIGPHPEAIMKMGSKAEAKTLMQNNGVPTIPGYQGDDQSVETLILKSKEIGFPILLKASAGGGGRGMRIVHQEDELISSIEAAKRESNSAFGNDQLIIEKHVQNSRHIEFQIFGDQHKNVIHILERECTIQRRYQKIIEESPSSVMTPELRLQMSAAAIKAAKALAYDNAGTVEFIYDDQTGEFYFLEVNTRLQVEHPVTEEITGLDLVQMQIESAQGKPLSIQQSDVNGNGYAIEVRIYAEDPDNNFFPVTGKIAQLEFPLNINGLRIETAIQTGSEISIFYDPMIAKVIVWDTDRSLAINKLNYVLRKTVCQGITTNIPFLIQLTEDKEFEKGSYNTNFVEVFQSKETLEISSNAVFGSCIAITVLNWHQRNQQRNLLRNLPSGWRNNLYAPQRDKYNFKDKEIFVQYSAKNNFFEIKIENNSFDVRIIKVDKQQVQLEINGLTEQFTINKSDLIYQVHNANTGNISLQLIDVFPDIRSDLKPEGYMTSMPVQVVKVLVGKGQKVSKGQGLIVLSSMKMESTITSTEEGEIEEIYVVEGDNVGAGIQLLKLKEQE